MFYSKFVLGDDIPALQSSSDVRHLGMGCALMLTVEASDLVNNNTAKDSERKTNAHHRLLFLSSPTSTVQLSTNGRVERNGKSPKLPFS